MKWSINVPISDKERRERESGKSVEPAMKFLYFVSFVYMPNRPLPGGKGVGYGNGVLELDNDITYQNVQEFERGVDEKTGNVWTKVIGWQSLGIVEGQGGQ